MEANTTSSSILVQNRLLGMIGRGVTDARIREQINAYFAANPGSGGGNGITGYIYDRNEVPASSWIIDHNLGRYPQVTLIADDGYLFEADILYNSLNQITVVSSQPISGKAVLL